VVDIDLERFFDRVNHDGLMARVAARLTDKRVRKLIRAFLNAGVMEDGLVQPVDEGTPQGGPLSPLLSNLVLDDLDKELTRRGHRFCRYADDCNIYVRSRRAGERVMASVSRFLTKKLKLKVNETKRRWRARKSESSWDLASRMMEASGASRRKLSISSRRRSGTRHAGHVGSACRS
jgi:RNA-directed DNA polymerase